MPKALPPSTLTSQIDLDPITFKAFLRDLLFREAGKPYFKRLLLPRRRYRLLGAWQSFSILQAERQLLPVGGRNIDTLIRQFFTDHTCLRAEFQEGGMPTTTIYVLRQHCPVYHPALERVHMLECTRLDDAVYRVDITGGPAPSPSDNRQTKPD
jgi:hypothetical protein